MRDLSSKQTLFIKFVIPVLVIALLIFVVARGMTVGQGSHWSIGALLFSAMGWLFLISLGIAGYLVWWSLARLKRVCMDDQFLYVSDYFKEIKVPLLEVEDIREIPWSKYHPITIKFQWGTEFGPDVVFVPKMSWFPYRASHPVVDEIWEAVKQAKRMR